MLSGARYGMDSFQCCHILTCMRQSTCKPSRTRASSKSEPAARGFSVERVHLQPRRRSVTMESGQGMSPPDLLPRNKALVEYSQFILAKKLKQDSACSPTHRASVKDRFRMRLEGNCNGT